MREGKIDDGFHYPGLQVTHGIVDALVEDMRNAAIGHELV